jgi:hypothetical protein
MSLGPNQTSVKEKIVIYRTKHAENSCDIATCIEVIP